MERNALCLSLFGTELKAVSLRGGTAENRWEMPEAVESTENFGAVVEQASRQTRNTSKRVALVLAHSRLSQQVVEVPPAKSGALDRFLDRRVQMLKLFDEPAAWSSQPALPTKNAQALLVHMLPRSVLEHLTAGGTKQGRSLVRIIPTTSVLSSQLKELPIAPNEVALLAAITGPFTTVVVGRSDGQVCHARILTSNWVAQPDRVALDLNRTLGFVSQQAGLTVNSVWLFGEGAGGLVFKLVNVLKLPVRTSPVEDTPFYWAEQAGRLSAHNDGNLVSAEEREAPSRRRFLAGALAALLLLFIGSIGATVFFETERRSNLKNIARGEEEIRLLERVLAGLAARETQLQEKRDMVDLVRRQGAPSVPGWFLGYMSDAVPDDLVLTHMRVARATNEWRVSVEGSLHPTTNMYPTSILTQAVASFSNALAAGPFHVRAARPATVEPTPGKMRFQMEGTIR